MMLKTPTQPAHDGLQPGRLWSLWEMLERCASLFVDASLKLTEAKWLGLAYTFDVEGSGKQINPVGVRVVASVASQAVRRACILADLDSVLPEIDRLDFAIQPPQGITASDLPQLSQSLHHLTMRIKDELESLFFFRVDGRDVPLYQAQEPFGSEVAEKFPKAVEDIQEAAKCLALQQSTACVFHLMRAMEVVVKRLGKRLGVKNVEKEWGKILSDIDGAIRAMPDANEKDKRKKNRWSEARANLYHVKQAWRNETMHPKQTYTREQAHEVFAAIGMNKATFATDAYIAKAMVHKLMFLAHTNFSINSGTVGVQDAIGMKIGTQHVPRGDLGGFLNALAVDFAAAFDKRHNFHLVTHAATALPTTGSGVGGAEIGFVGLNNLVLAANGASIGTGGHNFPDAVAKKPSGLH
ncbi:MAG: hypothetical protein P4L72_14210 [Parvibaculum sp.]|nr:hypothetical protein [Parvibaculum sp.]MDR3500368.1 hypothetical protein [Parvibaculum sp.]